MNVGVTSRVAFAVLLIGINASLGYAQWSTSPNVDSALFVCYGFFSGIVTYEDGSSIVLGSLSNSVYAQRLDEFGNKQWTTNGLQVHNNDSSAIGAGLLPIEPWGGWVSDGDRGVIFFWFDHRGSAYDSNSYAYLSSSIYAQRVDKNGNVRWQSGGVKVKSAESGLKTSAGIVDDGQGGCIICWADDGFNYPGASNLARITARRLSSEGGRLWEVQLDSSIQAGAFTCKKLARVQERILAQFYGSGLKLVDTMGNVLVPEHPVVFGAMTTADSTIYDAVNLGITKQSGDTTWYQTQLARFTKKLDILYGFNVEEFAYGQFYSFSTPIVADGLGGLYSILAFQSSDSGVGTGHLFVQHTDGVTVWPNPLLIDGSDRPYVASDGSGGVLVFNAKSWGYAQCYSQLGSPVWAGPVQMVPSLLDAENATFAEDHHGGLIMAFWTPSGAGIYAQHSGRIGRLGILTSVTNYDRPPSTFELRQNYPNPFNPETVIEFSIPTRTGTSLLVYNSLGQRVSEIVRADLQAGTYRVRFLGTSLAAGVYFYELKTASYRDVRRMVLVR